METIIAHICSAPIGTFTEIEMSIHGDANMNLWLYDNVDADESAVRNEVMQRFDKIDEWLTPCLVLSEERMKQIGLQSLNIEFQCGIGFIDAENFQRISAMPDIRADQWLAERVNKWIRVEQGRGTDITMRLGKNYL